MDGEARLMALLALHRYYAHAEILHHEWHRYLQASLVKARYARAMKDSPEEAAETEVDADHESSWSKAFPAPPDPKDYGITVLGAHWLAALYPLVEGWRELGIRDEEIDTQLQAQGAPAPRLEAAWTADHRCVC